MKEILANMLKGVESRELNYFLNMFQQPDPSRFAVIKISGECVQDSLEQIVADLSQLQNLGLCPIVVFGWGDILNKKLESEGIKSNFIDGNRVTDSNVLSKINEVVDDIKKDIFNMSEKYNLNLADLTGEKIFHADQLDGDLGYVGKIKETNINSIKEACNEKKIPLLAPIGYDEKNQQYNINADDAAKHIVKAVSPAKYIALTKTGGVLDKDGNLIEKISIIDDYDRLTEEGVIKGGMLKKVNEAKKLLEELRNGFSVQVASPEKLLSELFTFQGSCTKIVLGYNTIFYESMEGVDKERVKALIEESLNRKLADAYFSEEIPKYIILEEDCDGIAIVQDYDGIDYMDKFAVSEKTQNNGLGTKIFSQIVEKSMNSGSQGIFWRASIKNPKNKWYMNKIIEFKGGCQVGDEWVTYWIGLDGVDKGILVNYAAQKEKTLV